MADPSHAIPLFAHASRSESRLKRKVEGEAHETSPTARALVAVARDLGMALFKCPDATGQPP
jgi:hypothetical protein